MSAVWWGITLQAIISKSYATGGVTGNHDDIGGLVGGNNGGTVADSFWDTETTGQSSSDGGMGIATEDMMNIATYTDAGWNIGDSGGASSAWRIYDGYTYPLLRSFMANATAVSEASNKTYDGTTSVTNGAYTWASPINTEKIYGTASYELDSKNTGTRTVITTGLYSDQQGYDISYSNGTVEISPKALAVSGITASDKVYDGTKAAAVHTGAAVYGGLVAGDDLTVSATGLFSDKNAGAGKTVALASSYSGSDVNNYAIADQAAATADISPKDLTAAYTAADKAYDGNSAATVAGVSEDIISGDAVTFSQSALFDSKNAGTGKTVNVTGISIGGTDAPNYTLLNNSATTTADIAPKALAVSGITASNKVYDGTRAAAVHTGAAVYGGLVAGDDLTVSATGLFSDKNAGAGKTVALASSYSGSDVNNYAIADQATATRGHHPERPDRRIHGRRQGL